MASPTLAQVREQAVAVRQRAANAMVIGIGAQSWSGPDTIELDNVPFRIAFCESPLHVREELLERGYTLVEVPTEEFDTMGTNVLALGPRDCVMLAGNPRTRAALERTGVRVVEYAGDEISVKGAGGPTCLTRPLARAPGRQG